MAYTREEIGRQVVVAARSVQAADPGALGAAMNVLLEDDNWQSYIDPADRQSHTWEDFCAFVRERLGISAEALADALSHTPKLAAQVRELGKAPHGGPREKGKRSNPTLARRRGVDYEMGRLLRDRPDLAERVEAGVLSVHAAAVEAGFRRPTRSVPIDSPEQAIQALLRVFSRDELVAALEAD